MISVLMYDCPEIIALLWWTVVESFGDGLESYPTRSLWVLSLSLPSPHSAG